MWEYFGIQLHTVVVPLPQVFQIAYVIVKAANSPRPGNWILERSLDDVEYKPWQYHAVTDTECLTLYNIYPRTGPPSYSKDDEVICTSFYSKIHPLENGEVRWENTITIFKMAEQACQEDLNISVINVRGILK